MEARKLEEIVREQKKVFESAGDYVRRDVLDKVPALLKIPHAIIITGLRRSGKSTLLKEIRSEYFGGKEVYYLNFEDERLAGFSAADFDLLYETFIEVSGKSDVFFLDEMQNVAGWELYVRRMYDTGFKFIITGSNSSMLSRELGSRLTGRHVSIRLMPFSFREFLRYKSVEAGDLLTEERGVVKKAFNEYVEKGGLPEYLEYENADIVGTLYENILYRDILARYDLRDEKSLKELAAYLMANYGNEISFHRIKNILGLGSQTTVKNYIQYMENAYLIETINQYSPSVTKQIYSKKKAYAADPAFINLLSFKFSRNRGRLLENLVFLELKRRGVEIYYHRDEHECDYVVREKDRITQAIQVTESLENNREREEAGLLEAMREYGLKKGLILTEDAEETRTIKKMEIDVKPVWKWMIESRP